MEVPKPTPETFREFKDKVISWMSETLTKNEFKPLYDTIMNFEK